MSARVRSALVIGGGVAGPATALALRKAGIEARLYEARPTGAADAADAEGVFLTLASNGIEALRAIDADGPVLAAGFPTPAIVLRSGSGKRLGASSTGGTLPDGTVSHTLRRADLAGALRAQALEAGIAVETGRRLVAAEPAGDGVRARFADGGEARADVLIGCDGVHSAVRRAIDPGAPKPAYAGLLSTGGWTRGVPVELEPGGCEMYFGRRAFFGCTLAPDGTVWWFANVPRRDEPGRDGVEGDGETWRRRLLELFERDAAPAVALISAGGAVAPPTPVHTVPRLPRWHRDRMIVVGDAAHAPSPSSGQGASLAIEDAVVLAQRLRDLPGPAEAFAAFEAERRPRVERIVRWAARVNSSKAAGPVGRVLRDATLPLILRLTADGRAQRSVWDHRTVWEEPAAAG